MNDTNTTAAQPLDLDRLEALARAATRGPWKRSDRPNGPFWHISSEYTIGGEPCKSGRQSIGAIHAENKRGAPKYAAMFEANANFVAELNPATALALIAQARAAKPESAAPKCWSCKRQYTLEQRTEADGNCPHCGVEIELYDAAQPESATGTTGASIDTPQFSEILYRCRGWGPEGAQARTALIAHIDAIIADLRAQLAEKDQKSIDRQLTGAPSAVKHAAPASAQPDRGAAWESDLHKCTDAKRVMMSAFAFCPSDLSHPQKMAWIGDFFTKHYLAAPSPASQPVAPVYARDVYEYGPEGMPRVARMPDAVLDCIIQHSLFRYLGGALEGEDRDRLHGLMHDTANEVLARLPCWPAAVAPSDAKGKADAANAGVVADERSAFEAWGNELFNYGFEPGKRVNGMDDAEYEHEGTQMAWEGWRARAALSQSPATSAADAKDAADLRIAICDIPLPVYGSNSFQHGFVSAKEAVLDLLSKRAAMASAPSSAAGKEGGNHG